MRMIVVRWTLSAVILVAVGCSRPPQDDEIRVASGVNAVASPSGESLAFQRFDDGRSRLIVKNLAGGDEMEVNRDEGSAIHPCWAPDGTLVFSCCKTRGTAYEKWVDPKTDFDRGWHLCSWKDGRMTDLTATGARDFLPTVSPDGTKIYFTTTRGAHGTHTLFSSMSQHLAVCDNVAGGEVKTYLAPPNASNAGQGQCAISPDGKYIAWAQIDSYWDSWYLMGARTDSPEAGAALLPQNMIGVSPRWHPNARVLAFAGYREGDPGWCVYLMDVRSGDVRRICPGDNPCFMPDGSTIVYDRDGNVYRREIGANDWPSAVDRGNKADFGEEHVLWHVDAPERNQRLELPSSLSFNDTETFFLRVRVRWTDSKEPLQHFATLAYGDVPTADQALQLYRDPKGYLSFATRTAADAFTYLQITSEPLSKSGEYVLTGIKSGNFCYLSCNDGPPVQMRFSHGVMSFKKPLRASIGRGFGKTDSLVRAIEVGRGWPANVPRPHSRREVFE